jgi:hypothetical protein
MLASALIAAVLASSPWAIFALYVPSNARFIEKPAGESVVTINDNSGSISTAQAKIDGARKANPAAVVVINLNGDYGVTAAPLRLESNECLVLGPSTVLRAAANATAGSLISITRQSFVSVAGGTLDAGGGAMNCINATACSRVNIDGVTARNAGLDAIALTGEGMTVFDNEFTVTRCTVTGCRQEHYGISVKEATQAALIDDVCAGNQGGGIMMGAAHGTVVHCTCNGNGAGITVTGNNNAVTANTISGNVNGIVVAGGATENMCLSNRIEGSTSTGLSLAGSGNVVFDNTLTGNANQYASAATGNFVVPLNAPLNDAGNSYFYPPTVSNPHNEPVIVRGMGRTDVTIGSTTSDDLQAKYEAARAAHPKDVIVLHLPGLYAFATASFRIHSDTCLLLTGTFQLSSGPTTTKTVIQSADHETTNCYISGGLIDGGGHGAKGYGGINFSSYALVGVDGVRIQNFGNGLRHSNPAKGIHFLTGKGDTPGFIKGCTVHNIGGRGIYLQNNHKAGRGVITGNSVDTCGFDGYDGDSSTSNAVVQFNTIGGFISRYGIFFEEGGKYNKAIGNNVSHAMRGINMYSFNGSGTNYNSAICNTLSANANGIRCGSQLNKDTSHNFIFDNSVTGTKPAAAIISQDTGVQNYFSQQFLAGNATDYGLLTSAVFFNSKEPVDSEKIQK